MSTLPSSAAGPVLVCYDGSPSAQRALSLAARTLAPGRIMLLHVWNPPDAVLADSFGTGSHGPGQAVLEAETVKRSVDVVSDGARRAAEHGLRVEVREARSESSAWHTILEIADELDASLIVAGTHGTTAVTDRPLGSVSDGLVHHARRPVLIVPDRRS